ncbi:hypothetical protein D5071_16025 [Pectobacterium carotovorum]|uniref:Uncharacterized protein n=1 Tax=Pectobacterium carotovorum TaxID=554 RepID=A0A419ATC2_PECCA|nr:hypothetical protein D5071_16025 [Pectobacterium carotovorum]
MNLLVNRFIMYRRFLRLIGNSQLGRESQPPDEKTDTMRKHQHSRSYFIPHDVNIEMTSHSSRKLTVKYRIVIQTREH